MSRSLAHIYRVTYTCDLCGLTKSLEVSAIEEEQYSLVTGRLPLPEGWIQASSDNTKKSPDVPDIFFDKMEHFQEWKDHKIEQIRSYIRVL